MTEFEDIRMLAARLTSALRVPPKVIANLPDNKVVYLRGHLMGGISQPKGA